MKKTLTNHIKNGIENAKKYVNKIKSTVDKKYHTIDNTLVLWVAWKKFLSRGDIQISKDKKIKISFVRFLYMFCLYCCMSAR